VEYILGHTFTHFPEEGSPNIPSGHLETHERPDKKSYWLTQATQDVSPLEEIEQVLQFPEQLLPHTEEDLEFQIRMG
jgi:hypothetical protein